MQIGMLIIAPFHWTDPATWPWVIYVWLGFLFIGWMIPAWRWFLHKQASDWPAIDGRIESAEFTQPRFSLTTKSGYYVSELRYSYLVGGTVHSGHYKCDFPTEQEAVEFVRDLEGRPIPVHYNPNRPSSSALLKSDTEILLQSRAPAAITESLAKANLFPEWIKPFLWVFICFSAVGLVVSLWVHLGAVMGRRVAPEAFFWLLHVGVFVVWFPAIFVARRMVGNLNRKDLWKVILKDTPWWLRYMVYGFFVYAIVNFLIFMGTAPKEAFGSNPPPTVWRGFSGHWMAFYSAALAILYSAARSENTKRLVRV
jgi:hypothetical protein